MTAMSETMNETLNEHEPQTGIKLTAQQQRARRARSIAIAVSLGVLVVLFYIVTLVKACWCGRCECQLAKYPTFERPMSMQKPNLPAARRRDLLVAFICGGVVAAMVGASYAAVPIYSWFCRTTGYGGTTQVAKAAPTQISARKITVRFDSNVAAGLPWRFEPERNSIDVRLGEVATVYYAVTNESARVTTAQAGYNVLCRSQARRGF
jgi:hypothetical protein